MVFFLVAEAEYSQHILAPVSDPTDADITRHVFLVTGVL